MYSTFFLNFFSEELIFWIGTKQLPSRKCIVVFHAPALADFFHAFGLLLRVFYIVSKEVFPKGSVLNSEFFWDLETEPEI